MTPQKETFVSPNGDRLADLNAQKQIASNRLYELRRELAEAEAALRPLRKRCDDAENEVLNLSCRLNVWWNAFRNAIAPSRHK